MLSCTCQFQRFFCVLLCVAFDSFPPNAIPGRNKVVQGLTSKAGRLCPSEARFRYYVGGPALCRSTGVFCFFCCFYASMHAAFLLDSSACAFRLTPPPPLPPPIRTDVTRTGTRLFARNSSFRSRKWRCVRWLHATSEWLTLFNTESRTCRASEMCFESIGDCFVLAQEYLGSLVGHCGALYGRLCTAFYFLPCRCVLKLQEEVFLCASVCLATRANSRLRSRASRYCSSQASFASKKGSLPHRSPHFFLVLFYFIPLLPVPCVFPSCVRVPELVRAFVWRSCLVTYRFGGSPRPTQRWARGWNA